MPEEARGLREFNIERTYYRSNDEILADYQFVAKKYDIMTTLYQYVYGRCLDDLEEIFNQLISEDMDMTKKQSREGHEDEIRPILPKKIFVNLSVKELAFLTIIFHESKLFTYRKMDPRFVKYQKELCDIYSQFLATEESHTPSMYRHFSSPELNTIVSIVARIKSMSSILDGIRDDKIASLKKK